MKKSFKRALAALLASLMVLLSFPLTSFADWTGRYPLDANVTIQFGTFHSTQAKGWTDYTVNNVGPSDFSMCGLYDVPVDYKFTRNWEDGSVNGTLYIDAEKSKTANAFYEGTEGWEQQAYEEDHELGVGDFFTATFLWDDIPYFNGGQFEIEYSENIEPAVNYSYREGRNVAYALGSQSECQAKKGTVLFPTGNGIPNMSGTELYKDYWDIETNEKTSLSASERRVKMNTSNGTTFVLDETAPDPLHKDHYDVFLHDDYFANPETGALDGYTYKRQVIAATFPFKIVGEGEISFKIYDPYNNKVSSNPSAGFGFEGGFFIANKESGIMMDDYVTYAKNTTYLSEEEIAAGKEVPGSRKLTFFGFNINNPKEEPECDHSETTLEKVKAATCTEKGYTGDTVCTKCQEVITYGKEIPALNHDFSGEAVSDNAGHHSHKCVRYDACKTMGDPEDCTYGEMEIVKPATPKEEGIGKYTCTVCGYSYEVNIPVTQCEHNNTEIRDKKDATCTQEGYTGDTWCTDCNTKIATGTVIEKLAHTPGEAVRENEVPATCQKEGSYDEVVKCSKCGHEISRETKKIDKLPHTPGEAAREDVVEATCQKEGSYNEVVRCTECNEILSSTPKVIEKLAHTPGEMTIENRVEPTVDAEGGYDEVVRCTECKEVISTKHVVIPMLKSYEVTVDASDMGTVTLNGEDVTAGATKKIAAGTEFTLEAKAVDGAKFIGWVVNGTTTVSTDAKLTAKALADIKYTPVFAEDTADKFTVTFIDAFNNIISSQEVSSGAEVVIPEAPARPGYRFATENGWSLTNDEIKALDSAAVINAQYEKLGNTFTVTADGSKISVDGAEAVADKAEAVYDSLVTVTNDKATAWKVNGAVVGYGTSYTFYVGADVTVEAVTDAVTATPVVANIAVSETGEKGKVQAVFLATRTMTDNCKYITSGFVYGAGDLGEKTLDDVDGKAVKAAYTKTSVEQFSLTYGLRSQTGTVTARAFLVYEDENGEVKTIYTAPQTYTYASN